MIILNYINIYPCLVPIYLCIPEIHLILLEHLPADHAPVVDDHIEVGPGMELALPVGNGGERSDNEERPLDAHTVDLL